MFRKNDLENKMLCNSFQNLKKHSCGFPNFKAFTKDNQVRVKQFLTKREISNLLLSDSKEFSPDFRVSKSQPVVKVSPKYVSTQVQTLASLANFPSMVTYFLAGLIQQDSLDPSRTKISVWAINNQ